MNIIQKTVLEASSTALDQQLDAAMEAIVKRTDDATKQILQLTEEGEAQQTCFDIASSSIVQVKMIHGEKIDLLMKEIAELASILDKATKEADSLEKEHDALLKQKADLESPAGVQRRTAIFKQKYFPTGFVI